MLVNCSVEAVTPAGLVRFRNMDQFLAMADGKSTGPLPR
ncbi:hypothetical protein A33M_1726 [Rhodovulum sp. PH10]|nr:hypothetical protein A33M_1726 [Rhodovulum sp. PH10]